MFDDLLSCRNCRPFKPASKFQFPGDTSNSQSAAPSLAALADLLLGFRIPNDAILQLKSVPWERQIELVELVELVELAAE